MTTWGTPPRPGTPYPARSGGDGDAELGTSHEDGFIAAEEGTGRMLQPDPHHPPWSWRFGGGGGNLALPSTPQPSSPQQGMGLGPADAPSPPASIWHSYSQVLGAKAKGHSLYPAPT